MRTATPARAAAYIVNISGAGVTGSNGAFTLTTTAGQQVTLSAVASGATCTTAPNYVWFFNNAQIGTGSFITYAFTTSGTGSVVVTDACSNSGLATLTVNAGGSTGTTTSCVPNAASGITVTISATPTSAAVNQPITFTFTTFNDTQSTTLTLSWNFGDGNIQTPAAQTVQHTYSTANTYTVIGTVSDVLGHSNCATTTVTIGGGTTGTTGTGGSTNPRLPVSPNGPYTGNVNQAITFGGFAQSLNGGTVTSYTWTFGDGGTAQGQSVQHTYTTAGTFTVTLTATDSTGQSSSNTTTATIGGSGTTSSGSATTGQNSERGVTVNTGGPYSGTAGTPINFSGTATTTNPGATIASYVWAFGDGTTSTGQTTSHSYASSGNYTLTLTATDSTGVAVAATAVVVIGGGSSSGPRTVQLAQGCNNVALTFPDNTPSTTVANGVSPASALLSIWKLYDPQNQKYHAFFPGATQATDLPSINRLDAVFICVNAAATLTEPGA